MQTPADMKTMGVFGSDSHICSSTPVKSKQPKGANISKVEPKGAFCKIVLMSSCFFRRNQQALVDIILVFLLRKCKFVMSRLCGVMIIWPVCVDLGPNGDKVARLEKRGGPSIGRKTF